MTILSKLIRRQNLIKSLRDQKAPKAPTKPNLSKPQKFLPQEKFNQDGGLLIYESREGNFFKFMTIGFSAFLSYHVYNYLTSDLESDAQNSLYLSLIFGLSLLLFQYKIHKTPNLIWLDVNGRTVYIDFYRWGSFSSEPLEFDCSEFVGYGYYIHKFTRLPIVRYRLPLGEEAVCRSIFVGQSFKVAGKNMDINLSNKAKTKYKL